MSRGRDAAGPSTARTLHIIITIVITEPYTATSRHTEARCNARLLLKFSAALNTIVTAVCYARRLYILRRSELSRRRLLPAVSPAAGHLTTPTVAWLPGLCENFRPTTSKSSPILRLLSSHWATSVVRTRVVGVANVGDSLRRLSSLRHRIYNFLALTLKRSSGGADIFARLLT